MRPGHRRSILVLSENHNVFFEIIYYMISTWNAVVVGLNIPAIIYSKSVTLFVTIIDIGLDGL